MIELKRLAPGILLGATLTTLGLSAAVIVGAAILSEPCHYEPPAVPLVYQETLDVEDGCDEESDAGFILSTAIEIGHPNCTGYALDAYNTYTDGGSDLYARGVDLLDCYEEYNDLNAAFNVSDTLMQLFPEDSHFFGRNGTYLIKEQPAAAAQILKKALDLSQNENLSKKERTLLHNNFAWALLHSPNPDLKTIEYHSRRALDFEGEMASCSVVHTRLAYEFAKQMQIASPDARDFSEWVNVRLPYTDCLEQMQSPSSIDRVGQHNDNSFSYQVFSTFVMDGITRSAIVLDDEAIDYLTPTRRAIDTEGPEAFCLEAMGSPNPRIQKACVDTASQLQLHWVTRDIIASHSGEFFGQ